jgi:hypothetical protein
MRLKSRLDYEGLAQFLYGSPMTGEIVDLNEALEWGQHCTHILPQL